MEPVISDLVSRFENGSLSRRDLVHGLALLAAGGTAAAAQPQELDFGSAIIDHISIQVADLQRSTQFYRNLFGFSLVSEERALGIVRLGTTKTLVSLNAQPPAGIVDHIALGIPRFTKESAARYLMQRGASVADNPYQGLHTRDPDGIAVQIFDQR